MKMLPRTRFFLSLIKRSIHNVDHNIRLSEKPLGSLFFHPRVQLMMEKINNYDYDKIFRSQKPGRTLDSPFYRLLNDEELKLEMEKASKKCIELMQIPPIIDVTDDNVEILSNDYSLDGHDKHHSKHVFTDISFDLSSNERVIVIREPNGVLRTANKNERHRMNQIYFPFPGRSLLTPEMFKQENLNHVLDRKDYLFALDRACAQFEPDEEEFHRVLYTIYERINDEKEFETLLSTRHLGSFVFYLAVNNKINNILSFFLEKTKIMEASYLVRLYDYVNSEVPRTLDAVPDGKCEDEELSLDDVCEIVKKYVTEKAPDLKPLADNCIENAKRKATMEESVLKAHGVQ